MGKQKGRSEQVATPSTTWVAVQLCHQSINWASHITSLGFTFLFSKMVGGWLQGNCFRSDLTFFFFPLFGHDHRTDGIHMCGVFLGVHTDTDFEKPSKLLWGKEGVQHFKITTDISSLAK